jgi:alkylhydroperoxidase family enzyme
MTAMLDASPKAFFSFAKIFDVARHRESAPPSAVFAAKLVGALIEDCGPCVQLVVNMAREAKVPAADIAGVLRGDASGMNADAALGYRFAEAVAHRLPHEDEARDAVRAAWGDKGVIDLSLALAISRVFPMTKAGMGYAKTCRRVTIDGAGVDVVKRAA